LSQLRGEGLDPLDEAAGMPARLLAAIRDIVVPPLCVVCHEPELDAVGLCAGCSARLPRQRGELCLRCGAAKSPIARTCSECDRRELAFERAWAPFVYEEPARQLVSALKQRGHVKAALAMGRELARHLPDSMREGTLVPVPAHARRRRARGFNHAALLAEALGDRLERPVWDILRRTRVASQIGLERDQRIENARGSVRLAGPVQHVQTAILVDDVYTTGATLDACARALLDGGIGRVRAMTFARVQRPARLGHMS
jgi:ComF family protein